MRWINARKKNISFKKSSRRKRRKNMFTSSPHICVYMSSTSFHPAMRTFFFLLSMFFFGKIKIQGECEFAWFLQLTLNQCNWYFLVIDTQYCHPPPPFSNNNIFFFWICLGKFFKGRQHTKDVVRSIIKKKTFSILVGVRQTHFLIPLFQFLGSILLSLNSRIYKSFNTYSRIT